VLSPALFNMYIRLLIDLLIGLKSDLGSILVVVCGVYIGCLVYAD